MGFKLENLEARLARLFEDQLNIVSGNDFIRQIKNSLISIIDQNLIEETGEKIAPNRFQIKLNFDRNLDAEQAKNLENTISEWVAEYLIDRNLKLNGPFSLKLSSKGTSTKDFNIKADHAIKQLGNTARIDPGDANHQQIILENAPHLLLNNGGNFVISKRTTIIGRGTDCDLVIDNLRLSRQHARIVNEQNRFTISDLDSKIGTFVNGNKVKNHVLHPGDVISLGEVDLVFIDDEVSSSGKPSVTTKLDLE